jgi:hypothetical protein
MLFVVTMIFATSFHNTTHAFSFLYILGKMYNLFSFFFVKMNIMNAAVISYYCPLGSKLL